MTCCCVSTLAARDMIFETRFSGTPGEAYNSLVRDTSDGPIVSSSRQQLVNQSGQFGEQMVIAADGSGITQLDDNNAWELYHVATTNPGGRHTLRYDIDAEETGFLLTEIEIHVSKVIGSGIAVSICYELADGRIVYDTHRLNSVGVCRIPLSEPMIIQKGQVDPVGSNMAGYLLRVQFCDTLEDVGNVVVERVAAYGEPYASIPELSCFSIITGLLCLGLTVSRRYRYKL